MFQAIAERAVALSGAERCDFWRIDGEYLLHVAGIGSVLNPVPVGSRVPRVGMIAGEAADRRAVIRIDDGGSPTAPKMHSWFSRVQGHRSAMFVPLMRDGEALGVFTLGHSEPNKFSADDEGFLKTFGSQALIAMENARLFNALEDRNREVNEALEQQTAMAEVLGIISRSATDSQPVFDALAERAARLCDAEASLLQLVVGGDSARTVARFATDGTARLILDQDYTAPLEGRIVGETIRSRSRVHVFGPLEAFSDFPETVALYSDVETMCWLSVPLNRNGEVIGALQVSRQDPTPFTSAQVTLVEAFADQAVIAIENARLFNALEGRNREVTEALEQQTAIAEVLEAIAASPADLDAVLPKLAAAAARLCEADNSVVSHAHGDVLTAWSSTQGHVILKGYPPGPN